MRKVRLQIPAICKVFPAFLYITGCAHNQAAPVPVTPPRPPAIICAAIPDEPAPQGAVIRPITPAEIEGFDRLVDYELDLKLYAREGWGRARVAKDTFCK